jgi:voltage-gated potassium channel
LFYIQGDATEDENLVAAGIENASGIISALPADKDNLYITMTARMLNKKIRIVSRMIDQKLEPKLKMAGADRVVSPNTIGALRMASEMIRPTSQQPGRSEDQSDNRIRKIRRCRKKSE